LVNLFEAARRKQPYKATITSKAFSDGSGVGMKTTGAPVAEGAPYPSGLLPPVIQPGLTQELRYEPFIADYLPTVEIDAPSIEFLVHVGNSNAAAVVEELGVKADLGQQWDTQIAVPIKLAALSSASTEVLADFPEFGQWLPRELARAVQDVTTDQIVLGSGSGGQMLGIIGTPNVLTRAYNATTDTSGIDTVLQAVNDIRVGTSKAHANLAAMHPSTWDNLRRTKTTTGALVLSMMDPGSIGALDNLWGIQVVTNTYIPEGTAIVMDTDLACRWFVRQGLTVETNMWGDTFWQTNQVGFRAEMRAVLAVLRPTAISIVTGLFPYSGS
jgi:HK97 family phage major capsid protein